MYVRPPGYDPESAKAAEYADEKQKGHGSSSQDPMADSNVGSKYVDRNRYYKLLVGRYQDRSCGGNLIIIYILRCSL